MGDAPGGEPAGGALLPDVQQADGIEADLGDASVTAEISGLEDRHLAAGILRLNSLCRALSDTHTAVLAIKDRYALFREMGAIAVRVGHFKTAKIWIRERGATLVRAVVCTGRPGEYLDHETRTINLSGPEARGPTGTALLEGRPDVCNDLSEERSLPWRETNARAGLRSSAAFPLREDGDVIGTLTVYATETAYFDERLVEVLERIAAMLSLALDNLKREAQRAAVAASLRESEARFRSLTQLSADWYWQQDSQLRFTEVTGGLWAKMQERPGDRNIGKTHWEMPSLGVTERQWLDHKATLENHLPFRDFEYGRLDPDGSERHVSISGEPIFSASGEFSGYRGIGQDITGRKAAEHILALEHRVARVLADAGDTETAIMGVIRAICEAQRWSCGLHFRPDAGNNELRAEQCWAVAGEVDEAFFADQRRRPVVRGTGMSGRVWVSGQPAWMADEASRAFVQADLLLPAGFQGGFALPILSDGAITGVLTFFSRAVRKPDDRLLAAAAMIGGQVGQFMQRKHAEEALRESETRYRALTALSSDWYWEHDEAGRFTRVSEHANDESGVPAAAIIGKTRWETGIRYDPTERLALEQALEARRPFHDFSFSRSDGEGLLHYFTASGEPMFDPAGRYVGYRGVGQNVTARKLADDQSRFQAQLLNTVGDALIASTLDGQVTYWNAYAEQLYGWTAEEVLGKSVLDALGVQASRDDAVAAMRDAASGRVWRGDTKAQRRDGTFINTHLTLSPIQDGRGGLTGLIGVSRDIGELKRAEQVIRENARRQGAIAAFGQRALASSNHGTLLDAAMQTASDVLDAPFCEVSRFAPDGRGLVPCAGLGWQAGWIERHATDMTMAAHTRFFDAGLEVVAIDDFDGETGFPTPRLLARHGIRSGVNVLIGAGATAFGVLGVYSRSARHFTAESAHLLQNIASTLATAIDRTAAEEKLAYLAQFDALTGLPNRNLLRDRLAVTLTEAVRNDWNVGVMFVDLDGFKTVNDTFGHDAGDRLLVLTAERLQACVRRGDTVGRFGGDEFGIVLANLAKVEDATVVAKEVVAALEVPFIVDEQQLFVTASIGISVHPGDGDNPELLLKNADTAMYRAKEQGRGTFHFYTEELHLRVMQRMALERELRLAIEREEFVLFYQPQISFDSGRIVAVEVLVRWRHPTRGLLAPAEFISVAEETGLIVSLGRWVVDTACAQVADWHRSGHRDLRVAINVSPHEIRRSNVAENLRHALIRSRLHPRFLEVEVTETLVMDGAESFIRVLTDLKSLGITIAIDDFGTGYSSLSYLKRFPIDKIKIDQVFIHEIVTEIDDAAIVQAVIAMAHHLKLQVIAEGVESNDQAAFLRRCECDMAQGYLFSLPLSAADMAQLLQARGGVPMLPSLFGTPRSLLIVDDDPDTLAALQLGLGRDGYDIHTATSARQALEILAQAPVAVILADERMPAISGTTLLSRTKTLYPDTVRILLSGHTDLAMVTAAINEGAVYKFLSKPWDSGALREQVRLAFRHHEFQNGSQARPATSSR